MYIGYYFKLQIQKNIEFYHKNFKYCTCKNFVYKCVGGF